MVPACAGIVLVSFHGMNLCLKVPQLLSMCAFSSGWTAWFSLFWESPRSIDRVLLLIMYIYIIFFISFSIYYWAVGGWENCVNLCLKVPLLLSMCAVSPLTCLDSCESSSRLTINSVLAASNEVFIIMIYFMVTPISFVRFYLTRSGMVCLSIGFILSSPKYKISQVNCYLQRLSYSCLIKMNAFGRCL